MDSLVKYIQKQLDAIRPNAYRVSSERNLKSDFEKHDVVVSSLSGDVYSNSSNIPYQIDILTLDVDEVQADFFVLARNCNNVPFTEVIKEGETNFQSVTYNVVFNTPVTMEKSVDVGTNHYARLVAFASVNEMSGINQVRKISIDGEVIEKLNSSYTYVTEPSSARVSGEELTRSKKKASSCNIVFTAINKASVFFNKAFKISCGQLPGNTKFTVNFELYNGLKAELPMWVNSYQLIDERAKLPAVNISLALYDDRGDLAPTPSGRVTDLTNTRWTFRNVISMDSLNLEIGQTITYYINFKAPNKSTTKTYNRIKISRALNGTTYELAYQLPTGNEVTVWTTWNDQYWSDEEWRSIEIIDGTDATNQDLIDFLLDHAIRTA